VWYGPGEFIVDQYFAFLRTTVEAPDDPGPAQVCADWLEDQGNASNGSR
jgi:uncharacterized protein (TIGR02996 family)